MKNHDDQLKAAQRWYDSMEAPEYYAPEWFDFEDTFIMACPECGLRMEVEFAGQMKKHCAFDFYAKGLVTGICDYCSEPVLIVGGNFTTTQESGILTQHGGVLAW